MLFPRKAKGVLLKPKKSSFDTMGNLSGRRSLSFNLELVGRNSPISTPKVVEEVPAPEAFPDNSHEIWQKNNKPRFRLPIKFPKLKIPFVTRKERLEDSTHGFEEVSQPTTPSTPFNHDLHDSYSSVHGFAHESYAATEIALTDMAGSTSTSPMGWGQASTSAPYLNRTSLDPMTLLPVHKERDGDIEEYCPADDEFFRITPRSSLHRDWVSGPEDEVENDWKSGSDSTVKRRRPSSAYGWTGSSHRSLDTDRRDSTSTVDAPLPPRQSARGPRKGIDRGSKTVLKVDAELPVSYNPIGSMSSPESQASTPGKPAEGNALPVPTLFLGDLSGLSSDNMTSEATGRRRGHRGFGSDIPILDDFAGLSSEGSQRSLTRSEEESDQASSCGTMKESDIDSLFSDAEDESDYEEMVTGSEQPSVHHSDYHHSKYHGTEEDLSEGSSSESQSPRVVARSSSQKHYPQQEELQAYSSNDDADSYYGLPCMTEHPDEPDFDNCYPTTMVSDDATSRSQEERDLASFTAALHNKPVKTVLDILEEHASLKRKQCSYRVAMQRNFIRKMKSKVHNSKVAFTRLKQGLGPQLTDKVKMLREKWGAGLRIRKREKLVKLREEDEEELWDLHFNEYEAQDDSDADPWITDDDNCFEA